MAIHKLLIKTLTQPFASEADCIHYPENNTQVLKITHPSGLQLGMALFIYTNLISGRAVL